MKNPGDNLIDEFKKGNKRAFGYIYNRYNPLVFYIIQKYITDKEIATDIAAECFVKLWQRMTEFENEDHAKNFLIRVAANASIDYLRKRKNRTEQVTDEVNEIPDVHETRLISVEGDAYDILYSSIELLPQKCKNIVRLILLGRSTEEIAGKFKISPKTVRNQKARAIELLKNIVLKDVLLVIIIGFTIFYVTKNTPAPQQSSVLNSLFHKIISIAYYHS